jgi:two-component system phosphate regulon response regulator OmpR
MFPEQAPDGYEILPHILIVDDDNRIRQLVRRYLGKNGFVVLEADCAQTAREVLERYEFDALVVDVMMPGESGLEFTSSLKERSDIPVLLLTALGEPSDRITGFEQGADDYLPKPFEPRELVLRLNSILRRYPKYTKKPEFLIIGEWRYEPQTYELVNQGTEERVRLTTVESNLLEALATKRGEVISRDTLAEMCDLDAGERTIDVQVTRLRRKLGEDRKVPKYLQTVRGKGYLLRNERE